MLSQTPNCCARIPPEASREPLDTDHTAGCSSHGHPPRKKRGKRNKEAGHALRNDRPAGKAEETKNSVYKPLTHPVLWELVFFLPLNHKLSTIPAKPLDCEETSLACKLTSAFNLGRKSGTPNHTFSSWKGLLHKTPRIQGWTRDKAQRASTWAPSLWKTKHLDSTSQKLQNLQGAEPGPEGQYRSVWCSLSPGDSLEERKSGLKAPQWWVVTITPCFCTSTRGHCFPGRAASSHVSSLFRLGCLSCLFPI